jgi:hypothetical protein
MSKFVLSAALLMAISPRISASEPDNSRGQFSGHSVFRSFIELDERRSAPPRDGVGDSNEILAPTGHATRVITTADTDSTPNGHTVMQVGMNPVTSNEEETWVLVAPYVWTPAMRGTIGARGLTAPIDVSLSDLFDILFEDLNGAAMAHVEVGKGNLGLIFDALLMEIHPSQPGPLGGQLKFDIGSTILESMAMARVVNLQTDAETNGRFTIDLLGGARYYQVQNGIRINPPILPAVQADLSKDWVDLVFGARTAVTVLPGIDGFLRADFGGFGIGTSSQLTWNLITGMSMECPNHPGTSLVLGYRILDINETQQSGPQAFEFDVKMQGPFAAVSFAF